MTLIDVRVLLLRMNMTVEHLAAELRCSRQSIYAALATGRNPRVNSRLLAWYEKHKRRVA